MEQKTSSFRFCSSARRDDHIVHAAERGDLPAVRGHLRRDRGSLDRLFGGHSALHFAAMGDHRAIVAFLVAKGAAVDVVSRRGRGELSSQRRECHSAGAEVPLRCTLQHRTATWSAPSCCWQQRPPCTSGTATAGGLSRCPVFAQFFSPAITIYNRCSSTNVACLNGHIL